MASQRTSFFSSFTQTLSNKASAIPDLNKRLNTISQTIQQHARELPKNLTRLPEQLDSERQSFIKSKSSEENNPQSELVLPWAGFGAYEKELKQQILEITKDERHFTIPPPEDTTFEFDIKAYSQSAKAILEVDKELSKMRFLLVPKQVDEISFWRNYFYRVTTVKQAVLSQAPPKEEKSTEIKKDDVLFDFTINSDDEDDTDFNIDDIDLNKDEKDDDDDHKEEGNKMNDKVKSSSITTRDTTTTTTITASTTITHQDDSIKDDIKSDDVNEEGMEEWEIELRRVAKEV